MTDTDRERFATLKRRRDAAGCVTVRIRYVYKIYQLSEEVSRRER